MKSLISVRFVKIFSHERFLFAVVTCLIVWVLFILQPGLAQRTWCNVVVPLQDPSLNHEYFFQCSNVRQEIVYTENIDDQATENPAWRIFTPKDPSKPAILRVKVKKDRSRMVLYPRMSGPLDAVSIHEMRGYKRRLLFYAEGAKGGWSPVSSQYALNLDCVDFGWEDKEFDVELVVTIYGRWGQVWHKDESVFY